MAITRKDVLHVAELARLELTEAEVDRLVVDLGHILGHMDELSQVDTTGVAPTTYVAVKAAPMRPDEVRLGLDPQKALTEAPRQCDGAFAVPAFLDES